jgi:hypothetical protein
MNINQARRVRLTAIATFGLLVGLLPSCITAVAAETAEQRSACTSDAFRLCGSAMPDAGRVQACLAQNRRSLSPLCREVFAGGGRHVEHRHYRHHHH